MRSSSYEGGAHKKEEKLWTCHYFTDITRNVREETTNRTRDWLNSVCANSGHSISKYFGLPAFLVTRRGPEQNSARVFYVKNFWGFIWASTPFSNFAISRAAAQLNPNRVVTARENQWQTMKAIVQYINLTKYFRRYIYIYYGLATRKKVRIRIKTLHAAVIDNHVKHKRNFRKANAAQSDTFHYLKWTATIAMNYAKQWLECGRMDEFHRAWTSCLE